MGATLDQRTLADLLPGTWTIAATNFPMWLAGDKLEPRFTYELISDEPLVLSDDVGYVQEGVEKHILGQDTWRGDEFVWRGRKLLRLVASHWTVAGISDDGTLAVIHFSKSLATPSGEASMSDGRLVDAGLTPHPVRFRSRRRRQCRSRCFDGVAITEDMNMLDHTGRPEYLTPARRSNRTGSCRTAFLAGRAVPRDRRTQFVLDARRYLVERRWIVDEGMRRVATHGARRACRRIDRSAGSHARNPHAPSSSWS